MTTDDVGAVNAIDAVPNLLKVICQTTGMGFAAVARVTADEWVALAVRDEIGFGLEPGGELEIGTTICNEIRQSREAVVIDHVADDPSFCDHPTPKMYGFQSYISVPIVFRDGTFFGTLCAIDPNPAELKDGPVLTTFELFAELLALHLENREQVVATRIALFHEQRVAEQREQFIAVLGHDLRNPLAAIGAGLGMIAKEQLGPRIDRIIELTGESCKRMVELTNDILDMARGRMGSGVPLRAAVDENLEATLTHVVDELRTVHPDRDILARIAIPGAVFCDSARLAQLLSNLVGNALTHGADSRPVEVEIADDGGALAIEVRNHGDTIPPETIEHLFEPFAQGSGAAGGGIGLGLYIAAEVAKAHGGMLTGSSEDGLTIFRAVMPSRSARRERAA